MFISGRVMLKFLLLFVFVKYLIFNRLYICLLIFIEDFIIFISAHGEEATKHFQVNKNFMDRRENVVSARTYFYEDEHKCDAHLETFLQGIDAVGKELSVICILWQ